ncbi:MAG: metallophosphoesterase, partial [Candidatus Bathyarchaeia archaeon]
MEEAKALINLIEEGKTLPPKEILILLHKVEKLLLDEQQLVRTKPPLVIIGDLHGDLETALSVVKRFPPAKYRLVFLGDYVDRGEHSLETAAYLLALKLLHPERITLLRGNHESPLVNQAYGFYSELLRKQRGEAFRLFLRFNEVLSALPYAALLKPHRLLLVHGGVPTSIPRLGEVASLPKKDLVPTDETAFQLLWNDPHEGVEGFAPSDRG